MRGTNRPAAILSEPTIIYPITYNQSYTVIDIENKKASEIVQALLKKEAKRISKLSISQHKIKPAKRKLRGEEGVERV